MGITCLSELGVCRYLDNVSEVLAHVFYLCVFKQTIINLKQKIMKKQFILNVMKKVLLVLPLLALLFILTSCSKDESDSYLPFDNSKVVGSWAITSVEGSSIWNWICTGNVLIFNSNGTCSTGFSMEDSWKISSGKVCTYYKRTAEPMLVYSLLSSEGSTYKIKVQGTLDESNQSVVINVSKK